MAYVVVPMFQLTPGYPARPSWWFSAGHSGCALLVWSIGVVFDLPWLVRASQLAAAVAGITFAGLTLRLQGKRRRAKADATYRYWQMGMVASILALLMLGIAAVWPGSQRTGWLDHRFRHPDRCRRLPVFHRRHAVQDRSLPGLDAPAELRGDQGHGAGHAPG